MKTRATGKSAAYICAAAITILTPLLSVTPSKAGNFIGHSTPGKPGYAIQFWPSFSHRSGGADSSGSFSQLAWFSETGLTGTKRDQFELWLGFNAGYASTTSGSGDAQWGATAPQIGFEYYYEVVQPEVEAGKTGHRNWWISPTLMVNTPNGNDKSSGFGAGANQFSVAFNINNYIAYDRWQLTISPVSALYSFENRHKSEWVNGKQKRLRGGLSLTFADAALGYRMTDNLSVGIHHQFDVFNSASSDFKRSERGAVGPSFTYTGFASKGYFMSATLDFDYYNRGTTRSTTLNTWLAKTF